MIYGLLCAANSCEDLHHPALPAIGQASRQLRNESLPVFFSQNCFLLVLYFKQTYSPTVIDLLPVDRSWLNCMAAHVPLIRNLCLALTRMDSQYLYCAQLHLTLSADKQCATVRPDDFVLVPEEERYKEEQLAKHLQEAVNRVLNCGL